MDDLVEFLRARLDEDELLAAAASNGPWIVRDWNEDTQFTIFSQQDTRGGVRHVADTELNSLKWRENRDHITRHDPARVLREVEAKRRIIAEHERLPGDGINFTFAEQDRAVDLLRHLALPYSDHPDYQEAWHG